ncbi:unnamed protein product [Allacma fusca]|uniref:O-acyltransferase WSD1 C-terminal domain-containing protein n=1 Tax=Allacma fusca TaxID=39272 RepID=A0A8J2K2J4_9HEXA|nr:unnamed protein product [Allacma fusca]
MAVFRKSCDMLYFYLFFLTTLPVLVPLFLIFGVLPVLLYRSIAWVLVRTFRRDLLSFVSGVASIYVDPNPNKSIANFLVGFVLTGGISSQRISQLFKDRVLNLRDAKGNLIGLFRVAFRSPFTTTKLSGNKAGVSWKQLKSVLTLPYDIFVKMCTNESKKRPLGERHGSSNLCFNSTSIINVDDIKRIRKNHGVAYNAVILSAINGAIARALSDAGATPPETINLGYVLPLPNHPGGFNVHVTQSTMELPCYADSPKERLRRTHDIIVKDAGSLSPLILAYFLRLLSLAPVPITSALQGKILVPSKFLPSYFLTNMPVTTTRDDVDGLEIVDLIHGISVTYGMGLFISSLGVNNRQRFFFNMDKSVFGDEASAIKFPTYFEEELKAL